VLKDVAIPANRSITLKEAKMQGRW